ncbi:MAG: hypothetical protein WDM92_05420 [Caulobacteraceae bacterium]
MAAKRRRRSEPFPIEKAIVVVLVVVAVGLAGWFVKDKLDHGPATARARRDWTAARTVVAARLKQDEPLEFGAVWATHAGVICGLVNGKASFGGLTGMTPVLHPGRPGGVPRSTSRPRSSPPAGATAAAMRGCKSCPARWNPASAPPSSASSAADV